MPTFQEILRRLNDYWKEQQCIIHQGYDLEVGAGTSNPATLLRSLGPEPYRAAYIEPCRRPGDGRYGTNPSRMQHYFQYQVILKPSPFNLQELYLKSLEAMGFDLSKHDIRFVHDDWENPTLGAWGLGWEVWMDGMEITQFTYFQQAGGLPLKPVTGELTYGIERLALYLQEKESIFDLAWSEQLSYGDIYHRNEVEWSRYNFETSSAEMWFRHFDDFEMEAKRLIEAGLPLPAYDFTLKCSHAFNMLDARGVISVTERTRYIQRIRDLARHVAELYVDTRKELGFPLLGRWGREEYPPPEVPNLTAELLSGDLSGTEDFLLEIGSEELPAEFVPIGCRNLERAMRKLLQEEGIGFDSLHTYGTPRRISIYIRGMAKARRAQTSEKKGPALSMVYDSAGKLTKAGEGFFRSIGKKPFTFEQIRLGEDPGISIRTIKGVEYLFSAAETPAVPAAEILTESLSGIILHLEFPKKMRWNSLDITYARPIQWVTAMLGQYVIPFAVGSLVSSNCSYGHRQLSPGEIRLKSPAEYLEKLRKAWVMADIEERKQSIIDQVDAIEKMQNVKVLDVKEVLPQVLHLVEWPFLTKAEFDSSYLVAPREVLISEMVEHQKYFPVASMQGELLNIFLVTANIPPTDKVRIGNQRALSPRLNDGVFLYKQGLKVPLEEYNTKLKSITFQKQLGSLYDKTVRIASNAEKIQKILGISQAEKVSRAAILSKADLATEMVFEFPELQGIIGRSYALAQKEDPEVAKAIEEQWMPRGENEPLPATETGCVLSLADKFDNLIGCFAVNMKPSSSSDPYALRRQTLGIIKILIQGGYRLPLDDILRQCLEAFGKLAESSHEGVVQEIKAFIGNRVKTVFLDYGFTKDEIEAAISHGFDDIYDLFCKVKALHHFRQSDARFPLLYEVYKRARGQVGNGKVVEFSPELLCETAERELDKVLSDTQHRFKEAVCSKKYDNAYGLIAEVQPALAKLFDEVKVLDDDPRIRDNRIALLKRVFSLFEQLLDFSKIQG